MNREPNNQQRQPYKPHKLCYVSNIKILMSPNGIGLATSRTNVLPKIINRFELSSRVEEVANVAYHFYVFVVQVTCRMLGLQQEALNGRVTLHLNLQLKAQNLTIMKQKWSLR